jgi:son of sevenless-like protein
MRLCAFLNAWTRDQAYEFEEDRQLLEMYENFVNSTKALQSMLGSSLVRLKTPRGEVHLMFSTPAPKPKIPRRQVIKSLLHVPALETARQMTLIEFEIFSRIKPEELLEKAWTRDDKEKVSPNVMTLVTRFNQAVQWMVTQVVSEASPRKREAILDKLLKIAQHCWELNNFNGVQEILAAFSCSAVSRLLQAKKKVTTPAYKEMKELMNSTGNFLAYRTALRSANPPLIPYLGRFLTDLTFIEDANNIIVPSNQHIHFRKCYLVAEVVQEMQRYQQTPYNLTPVPPIREFLLDVRNNLNEEQAYTRSRELQQNKVVINEK